MRARLLFAAAAAAALSMLAAHARTLSATLSLEEAAAAARERATTRTTGSGGPSTTPIRSTASAVCTATSFVRPFAALADNYTAAIDDAVKVVCASDWDGDYTAAAEAMKNFTLPVGEVLVRTKASCVTSVAGAGSAQGCAHVKTSEADFEEALTDTHVEAVAAALERHCSCAKKWKWKFGDAEEFHEILATAYAGADVSVCASGNESATVEAFVECFATVVADSFAHGAAKASAEAGCYRGYSNDEMRAAVDAATAELVLECKAPDTSDMMTAGGGDAEAEAASNRREAQIRGPAAKPEEPVTVEVTQSAEDGEVKSTVSGGGGVTRGRSGGASVERTISVPE